MKNWIKNNYLFLLIIALAIFFRFWQIGTLPGGLFPDEAANGLDINSILKGDLHPFYERGNGREALFFYLLAIPVHFFGRGPWQHHIVSAAIGMLEVIACYFLAKQLFGKKVALMSSFFMAISSYAVTLSRTAFRANLIPLFSTLTIYFLIRSFTDLTERARIRSAILGGLSFGLGFYTYISFRMMIPLVVGYVALLLIATRGKWREYYSRFKVPVTAFKLSWFAAFAWIGYYWFISHPGSFIGRAGQVSIFNEQLNQGDVLGTLIKVFKLTMLSFFTEGDLNWRHNVSGYPFLSPFISPFFAIALVIFTLSFLLFLKDVLLKKFNYYTFAKGLIACLFWFMIVPEITTAEGIPHGLRLIGVIPAIFIMAGWGVIRTWEIIGKYVTRPQARQLITGVFLLSIFIYNFYLYFGIAAASPQYYYDFRSDLTTVSNYLNERNDKQKTYLSLDEFSVQTVEYFTTEKNNPYILVNPERTYQVNLKSGDQVVFTMSTLFDITKFKKRYPKAKLVLQEENKFGQPIMMVYQQP